MLVREKVAKSQNSVFFQWFVAPEGRKVGSLKRRARRYLVRWGSKSCTPLWCEAHFQVKTYKAHHAWATFGSWDVEKVHAVVARSTFPSQNVQSTPTLDHFWKSTCRKSARRWAAKHISKHTTLHSTPLYYTTPNYVSLHYTPHTTHYTLHTAHHTLHTAHYTLHTTHYTPQHTTLRYTTLHKLHELHKLQLQLKRQLQLQLQPHYITLHYANYTKLRSTPLHYATLNYITLRYNYNYNYNYKNSYSYTTLHYTALH